MENSYKIERGDIYWIAPGYFEKGGENTIRSDRPAIIVSNDDINDDDYNYEIVFLTTRQKKDRNTHVTIRSSNKTSTALCEQVTTVSAEQIGSYIGQCTPEEMAMVDACIMISLGLEASVIMEAPEPQGPDDSYDNLIPDQEEYICSLRDEVTRARAEADTIRKMYNELLERTLKG